MTDQLSAVADSRAVVASSLRSGIRIEARRVKSCAVSASVARKTTVSRSAISTRTPEVPIAFSISTPDTPN